MEKEHLIQMGIGASLFLIVLGAILAFALGNAVSFVNLAVLGYILIAAGVIGLAVAGVMFMPRLRRRVRQTRRAVVRRGIGVAVFLVALGAVLSFGVGSSIPSSGNLVVTGYVLMAAGIVGLIVLVVVFAPKRTRE